jgi:hypothetical protein
MPAQVEKLTIKHKLADPAHLRRDGEQRLGENIPLQYLEEADHRNQLVGAYGQGENAILIFHDGSVAAGVRILSPSTYFSNTALKREITSGFHSLFSTLNPANHIQAFSTVGDQDADLLDEFLAQNELPQQNPIAQKIRTDIYNDYLQRIAKGQIRVHKSYIFLNKSYPVKNAKRRNNLSRNGNGKRPGIFPVLADSLQTVFRSFCEQASLTPIPEYELEETTLLNLIEELLEERSILHQQIAQIPSLTVLPVSTEEVFRLYTRAFSPSHWDTAKLLRKQRYLPERPLRAGLANYYATETITDQGWIFKGEEYYHAILTLNKAPAQVMLGTMGETLTYQGTSEIYNLDMSLVLKPTDGEREKAKIIQQYHVMSNQYMHNPTRYPHYGPMLVSMKKQIEALQEQAGIYGFHATYTLHYWHQELNVIKKWTQLLRQNYAAHPLNAQFGEEQFHAFPYFLTKAIPGYTRDHDKNRDFPVLAKEAAMLLPMLSSETSLIQNSELNRRITILTEDVFGSLIPYDSQAIGKVTSFSGAIIGAPGSGKTTLVCRKIALLHSTKDHIIILDGGEAESAYRNLTHILGSEFDYIELKPDTNFTINVLETEPIANGLYQRPTPCDINRMAYAVEPMLREVNTTPLTNTDIGIIEEGIRSAFNKSLLPKPIYLRDLAQTLREFSGQDPARAIRATQLGNILRETWTENKRYGRIFDTDSTKSNARITCYTTKGLKNDPLLRYVMTKAIYNKVDQICQANLHLPESQRYRIHFFVDEAFKELQDSQSIRSIIEKFRLGRALSLSTFLVTQRIDELRKLIRLADQDRLPGTKPNSESNEIIANCNFVWLGAMIKSDAEIAQELLNLSNIQTETVATLGGVPGEYREFAIHARLISGTSFHKILLRLTDLEYPLYASNPQTFSRLRTLEDHLVHELDWNSPQRKKARNAVIKELSRKKIGQRETLPILGDDQLFRILVCQRYVEKFIWPEKNRVVKSFDSPIERS